MKKIISFFMMLMIISSLSFARRAEKPAASSRMAVVKSGSSYKVFYKGSKAGDVRVTIYNASNEKVYHETIKKVDGFIRPYNFSALPEGDYLIELSDDSGSQVEKISYKAGKIEKLIKLARVSGTDNKFVLSVGNQGEDKLKIRIYDQAGNTLYDHSEDVTGDFAKVYTLNELNGKVFFEVTDSKGISKTIGY